MYSHVLQNSSRFEKTSVVSTTTPRDKQCLRFSSCTSRTQWLVAMTVNRSWQIIGWRINEVVQCSRPWTVNRLLWVLSGLPCPWKKLCRNTFWTRLLPESFKAWSLCTPSGLILRNLCHCPRRVQMPRPFLGIIISFFTVCFLRGYIVKNEFHGTDI